MSEPSAKVRTIFDGPVASVVIDNPERRNAMDQGMWRSIPDALHQASNNANVRAVILRGEGSKAFVSGADITEFEKVRCDARTNAAFTQDVLAATNSIINCPLPVIAAIEGYCFGGGIVLSTACDLRIGSQISSYCVPAAKLGLAYEYENYAALARLIGHGAASNMVLTAHAFTAEEARQMGFLQEIVGSGETAARAHDIATSMTKLAPLTLTATKRSAHGAASPQHERLAREAIDRCFDSQDFHEGRTAFKEKRQARFRGA